MRASSTSPPLSRAAAREAAYVAARPPPSFALLIAGFLANTIVAGAARFTDRRELLLILTVLVYVLLAGLQAVARQLFLSNDRIIDRYEDVALLVFSFVQWTLTFMVPIFLFTMLSDALFNWTLPLWHEALALAGIVLLGVIVVQPRLFGAIGQAVGGAGGGTTPTDATPQQLRANRKKKIPPDASRHLTSTAVLLGSDHMGHVLT